MHSVYYVTAFRTELHFLCYTGQIVAVATTILLLQRTMYFISFLVQDMRVFTLMEFAWQRASERQKKREAKSNHLFYVRRDSIVV